ncbi:MAG: LTA synthase family protein [Ruminococcaceae bacterium]|nr:LTA synthase family protein [Oscillospiraceae bacterium]
MKTKTKNNGLLSKIIFSVLIFIAFLCFFSADWYIKTYGDLGFDSILYTLFNGLGGVQSGLVTAYMKNALIPSVLLSVVVSLVLFLNLKKPLKINKVTFFPFNKVFSSVVAVILSLALIITATVQVGLDDYIISSASKTAIFEEKYVAPDNAEIIFPEKKQNLIYIYLESMETTYFAKEQGGALNYNAIPELYSLAENNVNFSHNEDVGGFKTANGTSWTMGALVAQTAGIPLKIPSNFAENTYGKEKFLKGAKSINNVLKENGYESVLMFGSDAAFANRDRYFIDHEIGDILDLYDARREGIVPKDYAVWWGMEDMHLFTYAKKVLSELSKGDKPFAFTTLTVDTHHIDGYKCEKCGDEYSEQYENVLSCSSKQVYEFVQWIKEQPFYENTVIVIAGDHLTMDSGYINRNVEKGYERHVYNCFINSKVTPVTTKNRVFTAMDMMPSTLAAMGCQIKGNRLGLGTNLFSDTKTLPEEMGYDTFNAEISKNSTFYNVEFMMK